MSVLIIGYYPENQGTDRWMRTTEEKYRKLFDHDRAVTYLKSEIKESVEREISDILQNSPGAFYASVRFLFAEIEGLSQLYWNINGDTNAKATVRFMRKFDILTPTSGVHYEAFRHGLMHTHMPKWISKGHKIAGWYVSTRNQLPIFGISVPLLKDQVLKAIDKFVLELEDEKENNKKTRLDKFYKCYCKWAKVLNRKDLKRYARTDLPNLKI